MLRLWVIQNSNIVQAAKAHFRIVLCMRTHLGNSVTDLHLSTVTFHGYILSSHGKSFHPCNNFSYHQIHMKLVSRYYFHSSLQKSARATDHNIYICHNKIKPKCISNSRLVCGLGFFLEGGGWGSCYMQFEELLLFTYWILMSQKIVIATSFFL